MILTLKTKKPRPTYVIKPQEILTEEEAKELSDFLSTFGNQAALAREIGKSTVAVAGWMKSKKFPKYCKLYLEKIRLKEFLK